MNTDARGLLIALVKRIHAVWPGSVCLPSYFFFRAPEGNPIFTN